ncbi:hypothetical protein AVEN_33485-1 [Araneus ventricosus]|uniref:Uncharacterized protein n=1 Tax=Araneus ventricosus TaxID=182803 RepID=A0A4Y2GWP0_ARAVE|nr:hypothetical protein AVEN_33485-1 [Araneus ventricosus]
MVRDRVTSTPMTGRISFGRVFLVPMPVAYPQGCKALSGPFGRGWAVDGDIISRQLLWRRSFKNPGAPTGMTDNTPCEPYINHLQSAGLFHSLVFALSVQHMYTT